MQDMLRGESDFTKFRDGLAPFEQVYFDRCQCPPWLKEMRGIDLSVSFQLCRYASAVKQRQIEIWEYWGDTEREAHKQLNGASDERRQ